MLIDPNAEGLERISPKAEANWRFWEFKNLNMHRGIIDYAPPPNISAMAIQASIRDAAARVYKPSWWRGFSFGSVVQFDVPPNYELQELIDCVDSYDNNKGVLQWIIAVDHRNKVAYAAHMWLRGSLHERFAKTVEQLAALQYTIEKTYKDSPNFIKGAAVAISGLRILRVVVIVLGLLYVVVQLARVAF